MNLDDPNSRKNLEAALGQAQAGDFSGFANIADALANDDGEVRIKAAYICQRIGFSAAIAPLSRMASADPISDNRNQAIYALAGIGRPPAVPPLIAALADPNPERREDARTALYRVLGVGVLSQLADEEGGTDADPGEVERVAEWWRTEAARFDPGLVYTMGELASPGAFIRQLKTTKTALPDAILDTLHDWTGEDFGQAPKPKLIAKWEKWWAANRTRYEPGHRYFYGHLVP